MPTINKNLITLFIVNMIVAAYWSATGPLIPLFIRELNATVFQVSLVLFIGGLISTITVMPSGLLSDKYGERKLIIISIALLVISPLLYSISKTWQETILWTLLNMAAFSFFMPARMSMIADSVKSGSMATAYGVMNLAWPIGGIVGPFIGGFLAENYGWNTFFYYLSSIAFLCMLLSFLLNDIDEKPPTTKKKPKNEFSLDKSVIWLLTVFSLVHILGNFARGILKTVFPFYLTETFQKTKTETGLFFSVGFGIATLIAQFPSGLLADRFGHRRIMAYATSMIPIIASFFLLLDDYILVLLIYAMIAGLWSVTWPASVAYILAITPASKRGAMVAVRQMAVRLGFTIGPLIGGFLWDAFDPSISFYVTIFFFAASFILTLLLKDEPVPARKILY